MGRGSSVGVLVGLCLSFPHVNPKKKWIKHLSTLTFECLPLSLLASLFATQMWSSDKPLPARLVSPLLTAAAVNLVVCHQICWSLSLLLDWALVINHRSICLSLLSSFQMTTLFWKYPCFRLHCSPLNLLQQTASCSTLYLEQSSCLCRPFATMTLPYPQHHH